MLRKPEIRKLYKEYLKSGQAPTDLMHLQSVKEWDNFRLVVNQFPYGRIAEVHHMLITKERICCIDEWDFLIKEYRKIKEELRGQYDYIMEGLKSKSIPNHWHVHLIKLYDI